MSAHLAMPDPSRSTACSLAAGRPRSPRAARWAGAVRGIRAVLLATVVGMALLGAVVTHWMGMLVVAPGLGAALAAAVALVDPAARQGVLYAGVAGVVLVPFANGLALLGTAGGGIALALLVLGPVVAVDWSTSPEEPDPTALRELLRRLPTADLLEEWQASGDLLRSPEERARAAGVRALLLDELSRRDPGGVAGWLAAGSPSPDPHIRADRGRPG